MPVEVDSEQQKIEQNVHPVIIFCDVDGVLNRNYYHFNPFNNNNNNNKRNNNFSLESRKEEEEGEKVELCFLENLSYLLMKLETNNYLPMLVISSTWRLDVTLRQKLLAYLQDKNGDANFVSKRKDLRQYLYNNNNKRSKNNNCFEIFDKNKETLWITPDLNERVTSETRVSEINLWIREHRESIVSWASKTKTNNSGNSLFTYLALDDLDLLYTEAGVRNDQMQDSNFVCTDQCGLTKELAEKAYDKIDKQIRGGQWTVEEYDLLKKNPDFQSYLTVLQSNKCPIIIQEAARKYIEEAKKHGQNQNNMGSCLCLIS